MAQVEIYTKDYCPYCVKAKQLLDKKGVSYTEYSLTDDITLKTGMVERAQGRTTVPQIFINDIGYGGCDELYALEEQDKLDALLASEA